ncbi:MAG: nodulation protein NfeD [Rhizobacter sp.]|nr:nodulation protein NfeD [Rhizobacter sp.]
MAATHRRAAAWRPSWFDRSPGAIALAGSLLALLWFALGSVAGAPTQAAAQVLVVPVQEAIGPATADHIARAIKQAESSGAALLVLELDTPGGLDSSMRQIIQAILASRVPVATYVSPQGARAASAGTYILYASHIAAMAPATTLGAATPVAIGLPGTKPQGDAPARGEPAASEPARGASQPGAKPALGPADAMTAKQVHDAAAFIRGLAQQHGRNAEWAERAVREAVSLTSAEALREKVIDLVATDLADLLKQIDGRSVRMAGGELKLATGGLASEVLRPDWRHQLLTVIANPSFALILLMVGIYGLVFEFSSPGFGIPGTVGAICLLLAMFALQMLPTNYAALGLILLGMALLAAELLSPSFGVLGVGGIVAFIAGGILLFDRDVPGLGIPLPLIFGLAASSAVIVLLGGGMALRARRAPVVSGRDEMLGLPGQMLEVGDGEAWALVRGERWAVVSDVPLSTGQRVRVRGLNGLTLQVQPETDRTDPQGESQ